jgi:hypothetical protein
MKLLACVLALVLCVGCAAPVDAWREASRKPVDNGSDVFWKKVRGEKP